MKYPKLRELKEAVWALIKGPYTSRFPFVPHKPFERFRGRSEYHEENCVGCGACFQVCPARAIEMKDEGGKRILTVRWDLCIFCGQCQANCITAEGIKLSNVFDISTTGARKELKQTIEKEFITCACCQEPIACIDHYLWVAKRLGVLCFSNPSLMLFYLRAMNLASSDATAASNQQETLRVDRISVLCPRCRREAALKS